MHAANVPAFDFAASSADSMVQQQAKALLVVGGDKEREISHEGRGRFFRGVSPGV